MAEGIEVSPQALTRHAQDVRAFMGYIDDAANSAGDDFDVQAFGIIGMSWSWILKNWTDSAQNFVKQAAGAGHHVADQVAEMATTYQHTDDAGRKSFDSIRQGMDGAARR
jgi:hypothetical protein